MLPGFNHQGYLPEGIHAATWEEFEMRFGWNRHRRILIQGLQTALGHLRAVGCAIVYVDGSFVTAKDEPEDVDAAWDPRGVDLDALHALEPVFFDFSSRRAAQKAKFGVEFFPSDVPANAESKSFLEFFQMDRDGNAKGIVRLEF